VESLLQASADPNVRRAAGAGSSETPLLWVTSQGCATRDAGAKAAATALSLIRSKADVNAAGENDLTPLLHAAYACPPEVVVWLMEAGADTRARTRGGASAMALAIIDDRADNIRAMLDAGYDVVSERGDLTTYLSGKPALIAMIDEVVARSRPPEPEVGWEAVDVKARVGADGLLHVNENDTVSVIGDVTIVERSFRLWIGSSVRVVRVDRLDPGGPTLALAPGSVDRADRYESPDEMTLRWSVRAASSPAFATPTSLTYRVEYVVTGAVIPIWGVRPAGASTFFSPAFAFGPRLRAAELWRAWRHAPGRLSKGYLLDYDYLPFALFDWKAVGRFSLETAFDPEWDAGGRTFRRAALALAPGDDAREVVVIDYLGAAAPASVHKGIHAAWLAPLVLLPPALAGLWASLFIRQRRRKQRFDLTPIDREWIATRLAAMKPEDVTRALEGGLEDPATCLAIPTLLLLGAGGVLSLWDLTTGGFIALSVALVVGSIVQQPAHGFARQWASSSEFRLPRLVVLLVPAVVFAVGAWVFFVTVFAAPRAVAALALLWLGMFNSVLNGARPAGTEAEIETRYALMRARCYIASELAKPYPDLEPAWRPQVEALGLEWRLGGLWREGGV